jgi:hypothetical protein
MLIWQRLLAAKAAATARASTDYHYVVVFIHPSNTSTGALAEPQKEKDIGLDGRPVRNRCILVLI